jgi:uncharacterized protein YsxB (DUF464 family)
VIVEGHAGMDDIGKDIVCSAVSTLTYTLAKAVESMYERDELNEEITVTLENGKAEISISPRFAFRNEARLIFDTICDGYEMIARDYPQHVEFVRI